MRVKSGATPEAALDMVIEGVLIALVIFVALAFGGVHAWAQSLMQAGIVVMTALWLCRTIWSRPSSRLARSFPGSDPSFQLLGYGFVRTNLGLPILLFVILVFFQMVPLPRSAVRLLSPEAAASFDRALPGYSGGGPVDFSNMGDWLLSENGEPESTAGGTGRSDGLRQWLESGESVPAAPGDGKLVY